MKPKLICWDTQIFLAWVKNETALGDGKQPISDVVAEVQAGRIFLVASALVYAEVLENHKDMPSGAAKLFEGFMENEQCVNTVDVSVAIAKKAQQIRNECYLKNIEISAPDSIHIATAIMHKAALLHTGDKEIIRLSDSSEVDGLTIAAEVPGIQSNLDI